MDWILALALATFALVVAFLVWNRISTRRHQQTGGRTSGLGGPNDPIAGANDQIRDPETIRRDLDAAPARERERQETLTSAPN